MSTKAVAWALEQTVSNPAAKLVLVGVAEHADRETWVAWPSRATCALYAGCSPRSVTNHFALLETAELVAAVDFAHVEHHEELATRYLGIPTDRRPRLWLVNPKGAGGKVFYPRVENPALPGGKPGGNSSFHRTKTKPPIRTAEVASTVPDADETAALLQHYREGKTDAVANVVDLRTRLANTEGTP